MEAGLRNFAGAGAKQELEQEQKWKTFTPQFVDRVKAQVINKIQ